MSDINLDRFRGCLLGLAVGDAVGTSVEFMPRGSFEPVTDMLGRGPFNLQPGEWTDDTSMALCLASSLLDCGKLELADQLARYVMWRDDGYMSSNGRCFDIGNTVSAALFNFERTGNPYSGSCDERSAGNGSIMRLAPVPMFFFPEMDQAVEAAAESSKTTHGTLECLDACRYFAVVICRALAGESKETVLADWEDLEAPAIAAIARGDYRAKEDSAIRGSGYVVHSLEAALWAFWTTNSYREAILAAVNLGEDSDTTAAVCGQVAGAFYGEQGIPADWLQKLVMRDEIAQLAEALGDKGSKRR